MDQQILANLAIGALLLVAVSICIIGVYHSVNYLYSSALMKSVWIQLKNIHKFILAHLPSAISPASTDEVECLNRRLERLTLNLEGSIQDSINLLSTSTTELDLMEERLNLNKGSSYNWLSSSSLLTPFFKTKPRVKSKLIKEPVPLAKPILKAKKSVLSTRPPWR